MWRYLVLSFAIFEVAFHVSCSVNHSASRGPFVWTKPLKLDSESYILPESIVPSQYIISIAPDLEHKTFFGDVAILGQTGDAGFLKDRVILNSFDLKIESIELLDLSRNGTRVPISTHLLKRIPQWLVIHLEENLTANSDYQLKIRYSGKFGTEYGMYYGSYDDSETNPPRAMAMTEFQATYARTVFPCWDEPKYKASFIIRVARFPHQIALSNMPLAETSGQQIPGLPVQWVWDTFEESPEMSSYLVAIIVAELSELRDDTGGRNLSIWTQPGKEKSGAYALQLTGRLMDVMEEFTGIEYTLPKLDQVALPKLGHQAMEHWGIITYSERFLVVDDMDSLKQKQQVAFHVSHELSHQWFGNLVTLDWWNFVWLNEGFAEFFQYYLLDSLEPDWRMMEIFVVNEVQSMLNSDAFLYTHPITRANIRDTVEIEKMFDVVSYCKGGAIVRMLYHIMTPELFQKGIQEYLNVNSLKTVTEDSLWDSLRSVESMEVDLPTDIADIMYSWTHEEGYPLITVQRYEDGSLNLTQKRFLISNKTHKLDDRISQTHWWIPLSYTTNSELDFNDTKPKEWFNSSTAFHQLEVNLDDDEWIIFNIQLSGFYRVNYDLVTWNLITEDMVNCNFLDIHPLNRAQLLDDSFNLAKTGYIDYSIALNLTKYLIHEKDVIPWTTAFDLFKTMEAKLIGTPARPLFRRYVQMLVSKWYSSIGYNENNSDCVSNKLSRMTVMAVACGFGHQGCVDKALEQVYLMMSEADVKIPTDLEDIILCTAVNAGPEEVWQFVRKKYIESKSRKERESLLEAMACSQDPNKILQMLEDSLDKKSRFFKNNEGSILIAALTRRKTNSETMLNFFYENFRDIVALYGEEKLKSYFMYATLHVNPIQVEKLYKFISENEKQLNMSKERIISLENFVKNMMKLGTWYNSYYHEIYNWLKEENETFTDEEIAEGIEDGEEETREGSSTVAFNLDINTTEDIIGTTESTTVEVETVEESTLEYEEVTTDKETSGAGEDDEKDYSDFIDRTGSKDVEDVLFRNEDDENSLIDLKNKGLVDKQSEESSEREYSSAPTKLNFINLTFVISVSIIVLFS